MTGKTDVPHIDGCAKPHEFSAILAWLFVFQMTVFLFRSLLIFILVRTVLNDFYFRSFGLRKFLFCLLFVFLQLKNSHSRKTNGNNFRFSFSYKNSYDCHM